MLRAKLFGLFSASVFLLISGVSLAGTDDLNQISGITVTEEANETVIMISAEHTPTFSVFKLDEPIRLFVDVSQGDTSRLAEPVVVDNGVLDQVVPMQIRSNGTPVGRIIFGLRQNAAYDIKATEGGIMVRIDGTGRRPSAPDNAALNAEAARVRAELAHEQELLDQIRQNRERESNLRLSEERSRLEAERLRARAEQLKQEAETQAAEAARLAQEERTRLDETRRARVAEEQSVAQLNSLKAQETTRLDEVRQAREREEALSARLADARRNNQDANVAAIQAEVERARADKVAREQELAALTGRIDAAKAESARAAELTRQAERLAESVTREKAELDRLTHEREEASRAWGQTVARLETEENRLAAIASSRARAEQDVATLRAQVEELKNNRAAVETEEAHRLRQELETRETELTQLRASMDSAGEAAQSAQIRLSAKEKELEDLRTGLQNERSTNEARLAAASQASAAEIASRQNEIAALKAEIERTRGAAASADGRTTEVQRDAQARLAAREQELAAARDQAARAAAAAEANAARERAAADSRVAAMETEMNALRAEMEAARTAAEQAGRNQGLADQERAVAELRARYEANLADVTATNRRQEQTIRDLSQQVEAAQSDAQSARSQISQREQEIADLTTELASVQRASSEREAQEVARLQALVAAKEAEVRQLTNSSRNANRSRIDAARTELESIKAEVAAAQTREQEAVARERAADAQVRELTVAARASDGRLVDTQREVERLNAELTAAREAARVAATEAGRTAGQSARAESSAEIARLTHELEAARAAEASAARSTNEAAQAEIDRLKAELAAAGTQTRVADATASNGPANVNAIDFRNSSSGASVVLSIDGEADYSVTARDGGYILTIEGAKLPAELARRLDVTAFHTPVSMVSSFVLESGKIQIVATLDSPIGQTLSRHDGKLVWTFAGEPATNMIAGAAPTPRVGPVAAQAASTAPAGGAAPAARTAPAAQTAPGAPAARTSPTSMASDPNAAPQGGYLRPSMVPRRRAYHGRRINLTVKDADIQNVLTFLAREGRVNIVTSEDVKGKVTFHLEDVPWDLALDTVLKAKGLDYVIEQGIYRVASAETIQKEYEAQVERARQQRELKPVIVRLVPVNYGSGAEMATRVRDVLSDKGTVSVDERTNTLVIKDTEDYLQAAEDLVRRLDQQTPQILIEARIVEARTTFSEDIGIQWGGNFAMSSAYGNETGVTFPSSIGLAGGNGESDPSGGISLDNPNWAVNLPAAVGTGSGGAIGIQLGSIGGIGNLTLRLSAAEENGDVKIISSPRISTLDNRRASISQGVQIPISVVSAAGVNTQFFAADLRLDVEPHVTRDGHINLRLDITKNEPDFGNLAANGNPTIQKKEAHTELLIRDGDTTVIGGIYTRSTGRSFKKIPFLGDIPVLGWLFKSRNRSDDRSELLIFITPKIVNREVSL